MVPQSDLPRSPSSNDALHVTSPKTCQCSKHEFVPEPVPVFLPLEIQAMIIDEVAADLDPERHTRRIYSFATRDTLRALCTVNRFFESIAIRYLYTLVHITSETQLAAFRKAIAYFGRPTALAKHVRTFSVSSTTHIASFQFAQDLVAVLHVLRPWVERLLLDVRRRHSFRQTSSSGAQDVGLLYGGDTRAANTSAVFNAPWPSLVEVSVSEGMDQYVRMSRLPCAFINVQRLALGNTVITANLVDRLLQMPYLEQLWMMNSSIRWTDFERTIPAEPIATLMHHSQRLRRFMWLIAPRPQWDMDETTSREAAFSDAELLGGVPGVHVIYGAEEQNADETLPDGLTGSRILGEGAKSGLLWEC